MSQNPPGIFVGMVKEKLYNPVVEFTAIEPIGMNVGGGGLPMGSGERETQKLRHRHGVSTGRHLRS